LRAKFQPGRLEEIVPAQQRPFALGANPPHLRGELLGTPLLNQEGWRTRAGVVSDGTPDNLCRPSQGLLVFRTQDPMAHAMGHILPPLRGLFV